MGQKPAMQMQRAIQSAVDSQVVKIRQRLETQTRDFASGRLNAADLDHRHLYLMGIIHPELAVNASIPDNFPDDTDRYGAVVLMNVGDRKSVV